MGNLTDAGTDPSMVELLNIKPALDATHKSDALKESS
jgi:hypothetical protein